MLSETSNVLFEKLQPPKRGKSAALLKLSPDWDKSLVAPTVDDDQWRSFVLITVAGDDVAESFLKGAVDNAATGTRSRFHAISYESLVSWAKEQTKAKGKSKEPTEVAVAEACNLIAALSDEKKPISATLLSRLVKYKVMIARAAELDRRSAAAKLAAEGTTSKPSSAKKPKSGKGKKGKGGAVGPGKKASSMVKKSEEKPDTIDDEPEDGPNAYFFLQGFEAPKLARELAECHLSIGCIIRTKSETGGTEDAGGVDLVEYEATVRGHVAESASGTPLREFVWRSLTVGMRGYIDPPEVFDHVAKHAYATLQDSVKFKEFLAKLSRQSIPTVNESVDDSMYTSILSDVPSDRQSIAVILDAIMRQVEHTVDNKVEVTQIETGTNVEEDSTGRILDGMIDDLPCDSPNQGLSVLQTLPKGPGACRYGNKVCERSYSLRGKGARIVAEAERWAASNSYGSILASTTTRISDSVGLHRLHQALNIDIKTLTAARSSLLHQDMLTRANGSELDPSTAAYLRDCHAEEEFSIGTLPQILDCALREFDDVLTKTDSIQGGCLIAFANIPTSHAQKHSTWSCRLNSYVGFNNYVENVAPYLRSMEGDSAPCNPIGYDIGDILLDVSGDRRSLFPWPTGYVQIDSMTFKCRNPMTRRIIQHGDTRLTLHVPRRDAIYACVVDETAATTATFSAALADGISVHVSGQGEPVKDNEREVSTDEDPEDANPRTDTSSKPSPWRVRATCSSDTGCVVSFLNNGCIRQVRCGDRSKLPRCGPNLNIEPLATEHSRTYLPDGRVIRLQEVESKLTVVVLHPNGSTSIPAEDNRSWITTPLDAVDGDDQKPFSHTATDQGIVVTTRSDGVTHVKYPDDSTMSEFADGTRIISKQGSIRIECLGFAPVHFGMGSNPEAGAGVIELSSKGTWADFSCDGLVIVQSDGSHLRIDGRGESGSFTTAVNSNLLASDSIQFSLQTLWCRATDSTGTVSMGFDAEGQPQNDVLPEARAVAPRLIRINSNGMGVEYHNVNVVRDLVSRIKKDGSYKIIESPIPEDGDSIYTLIKRRYEENAYRTAYSELTVLPAGLARKEEPYIVTQCQQSSMLDTVRQFAVRKSIDSSVLDAVTEAMTASQSIRSPLPDDIEDSRPTEEVEAAKDLLAELEKAVAGIQFVSKSDIQFREGYVEATKPPPSPPRAPIDMTKKCFDDYFGDGLKSRDIFKALASGGVPKYFDSPEFKNIRLYNEKQATDAIARSMAQLAVSSAMPSNTSQQDTEHDLSETNSANESVEQLNPFTVLPRIGGKAA